MHLDHRIPKSRGGMMVYITECAFAKTAINVNPANQGDAFFIKSVAINPV